MMTNGPNAKVGKILEVELPRPRTRKQLLEHPDYYRLREELLTFLADCDKEHDDSDTPAPQEKEISQETDSAPTEQSQEDRLAVNA